MALLNSAPDEALTAFRQAQDGFQQAVDAGVENGQLYYNLGNTHLFMGEIGPAIADYRRAQRLTPNDPRLQANLQFARSLRHDQIPPSGQRTFWRTAFFWHHWLPFSARRRMAVTGYGLFWLLLIVRVLSPSLRLVYPLLLCLLLWVSLGISLAVEEGVIFNGTAKIVQTANKGERQKVVVEKTEPDSYAPQESADTQEKQPVPVSAASESGVAPG